MLGASMVHTLLYSRLAVAKFALGSLANDRFSVGTLATDIFSGPLLQSTKHLVVNLQVTDSQVVHLQFTDSQERTLAVDRFLGGGTLTAVRFSRSTHTVYKF